MSDVHTKPIQGSLFEEDYLLRTLGAIVNSPDVALTELVANAWDAGASKVVILIPDHMDEELAIEDDGHGIPGDEFRKRWMTLGYNRVKHQGKKADLPPGRENWHRQAYGRNGIGRHSLLCFADQYTVETRRNGQGKRYVISTGSGNDAFFISNEEAFEKAGHGTRLSVIVERHLPTSDRIRDILSTRFLHDPTFSIAVNGKSVPLSEHPGLLKKSTLIISDTISVEVFFIDLTDTTVRKSIHRGIAFWIGGRLVGTPSWTLGDNTILDGRTRMAKTFGAVIRTPNSSDLVDEVLSDWSGFKKTDTVDTLFSKVGEHVESMIRELSSERIEETKAAIVEEHSSEIQSLPPSARVEVSEFLTEITSKSITIQQENVSLALKAVINLEKSRYGVELLQKLSEYSEKDIEGLNRLLSEWSVKDALTVLDEIDRRIRVIHAIEKLSTDPKVDELKTLHPLVTDARWLFGPEFDSPEYTSNVSLKRAVEEVFRVKYQNGDFINHKKRPDLIVFGDSSLGATCVETFDPDSKLSKISSILLIELKRGGFKIRRNEVNQAMGYVEDILNCGHIEGRPYVSSFVVGDQIEEKMEEIRTVGESPVVGKIRACTFARLVRTADKRLFKLKEQLEERYAEIPNVKGLASGLSVEIQAELPL